jgi:hypothetical protein
LNFRPFQEKDTYGNEVSRLGRPLPVEYLLLDVPASTPRHPDLHLQLGPGQATVPGGKPPAGRRHPGLQRPQPVPLAVQLERVLHSHQRFPPVALHSDHGHAAHEGVHGAVAEGPQEQGRRRRRGVVEQRALGHHRTADSGQFAAPVEVSSARDLCRFKSVFVGAGRAA